MNRCCKTQFGVTRAGGGGGGSGGGGERASDGTAAPRARTDLNLQKEPFLGPETCCGEFR